MNYHESELYKAKKDLVITQALSFYYESLSEDSHDIEMVEEVMQGYGFFQGEESESKPLKLSVISGNGSNKKTKKKAKLKVIK